MSALALAVAALLSIYIPGSGGGSSSSVTEAPDWASDANSDYATDMLGGALATAGWVQANTIGAGDAIDSVSVDTGSATGRAAIVLSHVSAGFEDAGYLTAIPAGDVCYAIRFGYETPTISTATMNHQLYAVFVGNGGDNLDNDEWFGLGWYRAGVAYTASNNFQSGQGGSPGDQWLGNTAGLVRETPLNTMDVLFKRSGTDLTIYQSPPRTGTWIYSATYTVDALAGVIGIRSKTNGAQTITSYIFAFRRFSTCPR